MKLIIDTHVHLYPCYDIKQALYNLRTNLAQLDSQAICIALLAERFDCNFFSEFEEKVAGLLNEQTKVRRLNNALHLSEPGYPDLYIFPGRQVITQEKIEILALTTDEPIKDGLKATDVLDRITKHKGIPVLSWAPGKWFFNRGKIVQDLIDSNQPGSLLIGDTTLRPTCWPLPLLMRRARQKGLTIISGSDPLPFAGEENIIGKYGIHLDHEFDPNNPLNSIRKLLTQPGIQPDLVGKRGGLLTTLQRLFKNAQSKKQK